MRNASEKKIAWIRRNSLKSPESAKGIQTDPREKSLFIWFYLDKFALGYAQSAGYEREAPGDAQCDGGPTGSVVASLMARIVG
jgi:hypothetical protein